MISQGYEPFLERKYCTVDQALEVRDGCIVAGYASLFGLADQGGDVVQPGAYAASLQAMSQKGRQVKMLWQHDPAHPIGIWDDVHEDARGLYVKGRLLTDVAKGREAAALIEAGAIDGLSIGYRTKKAMHRDEGGRALVELDLWEVSLVTFPMLPEARVDGKSNAPDEMNELAEALMAARRDLAVR